jgi:hypothetical protein
MPVQDVTVKNTAANPVVSSSRDNPARQPFQRVVMSDPAVPGASQSFDVPTGKCLVIECVSGFVNMPTGGKVSELSVQTTVGGQSALHRLPVALMLSAGGTDRYVTCQLLRAYAGPGTTVGYAVGTSGSGAQSSTLTISGHLVDVP